MGFIRSHLSYANVTATLALVVALSGGAYAAISSIPDGAGVFHGCVDKRTGALRVVTSARSCRRATTVKRGKHRVRLPGELAVAWNQTGQKGTAGIPGTPGAAGSKGDTGAAGTARAYATMRPDECFPPSGDCTIYNVKNIASIRRISTGTYCVAPTPGLSFKGVTPALTIDAFNSGPDSLGSGFGVPVVAYSSSSLCASGEIGVNTYRESATANGTPALSDNSSFGIVVP